jgi:hypothetical protein
LHSTPLEFVARHGTFPGKLRRTTNGANNQFVTNLRISEAVKELTGLLRCAKIEPGPAAID